MRLRRNDFMHFTSKEVVDMWTEWVQLWDGKGRNGVYVNNRGADLYFHQHSGIAAHNYTRKVTASVAEGE